MTAQIDARAGLTPIQWLVCAIAAIGFAFDIYELLMAPLVFPDAIRDLTGFAQVLQRAIAPGHDWDARLFHHLAGLGLVPHQLDDFWTRTNERHPNLSADLGQIRILSQKPVSRVDGVAAGDQRRADDRRDVVV